MRSKLDWQSLFDEWQSSGLSKAAFAKSKGLYAPTLYNAFSDLKKGRKPARPPKKESVKKNFLEIESLDSPNTFEVPKRLLRLTTSYGAIIEVPL